jgi:hypothetical protein
MSKAYYFVKNFRYKQTVDLFCYETLFPAKLTTTQRTTRLYLNILRSSQREHFHEHRGQIQSFMDRLVYFRGCFEELLERDREIEFVNKKHAEMEKEVAHMYDVELFVRENRPYSRSSGKYNTFSNEDLAYDPFGYYGEKMAHEANPGSGYPLLADYPTEEYYAFNNKETPLVSYSEPFEEPHNP